MSEATQLEERCLQLLPFDRRRGYKLGTDVRPEEDNESLGVLDVGGTEGIVPSFLYKGKTAIPDLVVVDDAPRILGELGGRYLPKAKDGFAGLLGLYGWLPKGKHPMGGSL